MFMQHAVPFMPHLVANITDLLLPYTILTLCVLTPIISVGVPSHNYRPLLLCCWQALPFSPQN